MWFANENKIMSLKIKLRSFFFFQAEDGIRDYKVTGVQTCALPISCLRRVELALDDERAESGERRFDLVPGFRRREEELGTVGLRELRHVPFLELGA